MLSWPFGETLPVVAVGKRLALLLVAVAVYSLAAGVVIWWWNIHVPDWGSAAGLINTIILSLLMSFRNRAAYDRWWEARGLWGKLTNDTRNLAGKLAAFLPAEVLARSRVAEVLAAFPEALKRHLRDGAVRLRELPGFEHEEADPAHVPQYLAGRVYAAVAEWKREGHIDDAVLWVLDPHLRGLLDVCGGCERIRNTPLSPSYKGLLRAGLVLNVLVSPWLTIAEIGFWGVPVFELVCFFLLGVELIDTVVEEPFGRERDDLDLDRYCRTIRDGVQASLAFVAETSAAGGFPDGRPTDELEATNRVTK
jgi:putative membrane protein